MGILAGLLPLFCASCGGIGGGSCTLVAVYGLNVKVVDDTTNQPICDASVKAVDGAYNEQLESRTLGTNDCTYTGAAERAGNYTLTAMKSGFVDTTQAGNVVTKDACHVQGITVTLRLRH